MQNIATKQFSGQFEEGSRWPGAGLHAGAAGPQSAQYCRDSSIHGALIDGLGLSSESTSGYASFSIHTLCPHATLTKVRLPFDPFHQMSSMWGGSHSAVTLKNWHFKHWLGHKITNLVPSDAANRHG